MDNTARTKLIIGFIAYNDLTAKYLPYFLDSLTKQTYRDVKIIAIDNSEEEDNENSRVIRKNYPDIDLAWAGGNTGFARAYNKLIERALAAGAEYFLALNPDMIFEDDFAAEMVKTIAADGKIGAAAPKILKWDFAANKKTATVDSRGIYITRQFRFSDIGQGESDRNDPAGGEVFGFTGAAVLFRLDALKDIAYKAGGREEYFDELMFMYKEDCDLSLRLRLAGWKTVLAPRALAYHDRTASPRGGSNLKIAFNRRNKSRAVKKWAFLNQWILILKYRKLPFSPLVKMATAWYQLKSLAFVVFFEPYLLKELMKLRQIRGEITNRRKQLNIKVNIKDIEKFMFYAPPKA